MLLPSALDVELTNRLAIGRVDLSIGKPYKGGPKAVEAGLKEPLKIPSAWPPSVLALGFLRGQYRDL